MSEPADKIHVVNMQCAFRRDGGSIRAYLSQPHTREGELLIATTGAGLLEAFPELKKLFEQYCLECCKAMIRTLAGGRELPIEIGTAVELPDIEHAPGHG